jgi:hypothetical protein
MYKLLRNNEQLEFQSQFSKCIYQKFKYEILSIQATNIFQLTSFWGTNKHLLVKFLNLCAHWLMIAHEKNMKHSFLQP